MSQPKVSIIVKSYSSGLLLLGLTATPHWVSMWHP